MTEECDETMRTDIIRMIFDLPKDTKVYSDYSCALKSGISVHGRMYPTEKHVCFYSNLFGSERKVAIPYDRIVDLSKTSALLSQAIQIDTNDGHSYVFFFFGGNSRDDCFNFIQQLRSGISVLPSEDVLVDQKTREHDHLMQFLLEHDFETSVDHFVTLFLNDDAIYSYTDFLKDTDATEISCEPWNPYPEDETYGFSRSLQFRVPVEAPIGPNSTRVDVLQRLRHLETGNKILETSTRLEDIPYGDYFTVEDRWTIQSIRDEKCRVKFEIAIAFTKSTIWKSKIESRAKEDCKLKFQKWCQMAKNQLNPSTTTRPVVEEQEEKKEKILIHDPMRFIILLLLLLLLWNQYQLMALIQQEKTCPSPNFM